MSTDLKVVVDGIIYQLQSHGGISRIFSEILPRMCDMDESLRIKLFTMGKVRKALPAHTRISHHSIPQVERYLRPRRVWKSIAPQARDLVKRVWIGHGDVQIWHSTYYTLPVEWNGLQVVTVADMIYERFADLFNTPEDVRLKEQKHRCVQRADAVICISKATAQDVQRFYGIDTDRIHVVYLGYSEVFRQIKHRDGGLQIPEKQPFLLFVGARYHYKNFNKLIRAYSVWSHRKDVALVVVGRPWSDDEGQCLRKLGIQDSVQLFTNICDEELRQFYNQATAFVYPSLYEGFGIPLLESMACGCPVIASRIPSTIEVAGNFPIYFEPTEEDALLNAFDVALSEGRNSQRVSVGFKRIKFYSWDKTATQTMEVYRTISKAAGHLR